MAFQHSDVPADRSFWLFFSSSSPCNKRNKKGDAHWTDSLPIAYWQRNRQEIVLNWVKTEIRFVQENDRLKMKIPLDRDAPRLIPTIAIFPPTFFLLISTFKNIGCCACAGILGSNISHNLASWEGYLWALEKEIKIYEYFFESTVQKKCKNFCLEEQWDKWWRKDQTAICPPCPLSEWKKSRLNNVCNFSFSVFILTFGWCIFSSTF